jgi:cytochrome P450
MTQVGDEVPREDRITDPALQQCPVPLYKRLQASDSTVRDEPGLGWLVWREQAIREIMTDTATYSSEFYGEDGPVHMGVSTEPFSDEVRALIDQFYPMDNALFCVDPPVHNRHRSLARRALSPRWVRSVEPDVSKLANELIDSFVDAGRCELVKQFAIPLPLIIIADKLGVPRDNLTAFRHWSDAIITGNMEVLDNTKRAEIAEVILEYQQYFLERIAERRAEPADDLLSELIAAQVDDEEITDKRPLTDSELLTIVGQILAAGNETTSSLIGSGLVIMLQRPDVMEEVRADFSLIPGFVEEVLRYNPPQRITNRRVKCPAKLHEADVEAGDLVITHLGAANYDESLFESPDTFDLHRENARKHLSFGHGPHFCPGAELARTEARISFETLLTRFEDIRLVNADELTRYPTYSILAWEKIELEFTPAKG